MAITETLTVRTVEFVLTGDKVNTIAHMEIVRTVSGLATGDVHTNHRGNVDLSALDLLGITGAADNGEVAAALLAIGAKMPLLKVEAVPVGDADVAADVPAAEPSQDAVAAADAESQLGVTDIPKEN